MRRFLRKVIHRESSSKNSDPETEVPRGSSSRNLDSANEVPEVILSAKSKQSGLYLLSDELPPSDESNIDRFEVDIVAIHGLNGDAFNTWTYQKSRDNKCLWLKDLLPHEIRGARIYSYNYPAQLLFSQSKASISDYAQNLLVNLSRVRIGKERRSLIFIAHSLGGIVCKQALIFAKRDPEYSLLLENTKGILFFATPHRGSESFPEIAIFFSDILDIVTKTTGVQLLVGKTKDDLLANLKTDAEILRNMLMEFRHVVPGLDIVTLYETEKQMPLGKLVVSRESAMLGLPRERLIPMYANHTDIYRFEGSSDEKYVTVAHEIKKLCRVVYYEPSMKESEKACVRLFNDTDVKEYRSTLPEHVNGTCSWVLNSPQYKSWIEGDEVSMLWISGHPGSGKTILSSFLSKQLETSGTVNRPEPMLCLFFCNDNIENQRDARAILQSIIFQILIERRDMVKHVKHLLAYDEHGSHLLKSYNSLWSIFLSIVSDAQIGRVIIIIDALDECEKSSRHRLMNSIADLIRRLRSMVSRAVRFLVTSRPHLTTTDLLINYEPIGLSLEENQSEIDADIRRVIGQRVERLAERTKAKQDTIAILERSLNEKADRTFLWAKFALDILDEELLSAPGDFERILAELPRDLEETYGRFLSKVPSGREAFASRLLHLLLASYRPLTLDEINVMIAMWDAGATGCDNLQSLQKYHIRTNMRADINKVLGSLVRISDSKVYLVHISLKEFLCTSIRHLEDKALVKTYHTDLPKAHDFVAMGCMQYLALNDFADDLYRTHGSSISDGSPPSSHPASDRPEEDDQSELLPDLWGNLLKEEDEVDAEVCALLAQRYSLFGYSAAYWARHYAQSQYVASKGLQKLALRLLDKSEDHRFMNWFRFYWVYDGPSIAHPTEFGSLITAAFFGHETSLDLLLGQNEGDFTDSLGGALYWASRNGNNSSVVRILRTKVEPDVKRIDRHNALGIAAELGHLAVARVLGGDARVDVDLKGKGDRTPLSLAAGHGHTSIVRLLLDYEHVDPNTQDHKGIVPLTWAIRGHYLDILHMLVYDSRVDINLVDKKERTPFSWAAAECDGAVTERLLKCPGINVSLPDIEKRTPLSWAAETGHTAVIKQLKDRKELDISHSHRDHNGRNAIAWAAGKGRQATLKLLIKYKLPGLDEADDSGWTPICWAIEEPTGNTLATLIETGMVNLNHRDHSGRNVVSLTVSYGNEATLQLLLAAEGIDAQSRDNQGQTPLDLAKSLGKPGMIRLLEEFLHS